MGGAASCIGRIGGLAVALGIGTAVITGQGVAYATPSTDGDPQGGAQPGGDDAGDNPGITTASDPGDPGDPGKIEVNKPPRLTDLFGRHRATGTTPNSVTATSIVKRLSDAADKTAKQVTDALQNAAGAVDGDNTDDNTAVLTKPRSGGSSTLADRIAARAERDAQRTSAPDVSTAEVGNGATNNFIADGFANRTSVVKEWLNSPSVAAGRAPAPPASTPTSLWTPPRIFTPLQAMTQAPTTPTTPNRTPNLLSVVLSGFNPFAGSSPTTPTPESPMSWVLLGASRRQIGVESLASQSLLAPSDKLNYDPDITLVNGVMTYNNTNAPTGVTYTVVSQPSGGGKVLIDPNTGSFSFLPDLSSVRSGTEEEFSVLVAETTPFTTAITQIPVLGSVASEIIVVLHQVPILNDVLAPIIGRSTVVVVPVDVGELAPAGTPVAFTVMVASPVDGALISTNYFPASTIVSGEATSAPTILNGPGLATAGNTDPTSTSIVDGLVPGLQPLRDAGYNVVTWDPRGEFASGGVLQLDSPEYEGRDVGGIIDFLVANDDITYQAYDAGRNNPPAEEGDTDDPAIGMVGGSYGGGIQLVTAAIDPRVDVIVPVIAWNSLTGSLYTNEAFKTSYSALLALGLLTTGARINPQIYAGIITGATLGILTPSQQALLNRSGPGGPEGFADDITQPTLFIQGTVDVLFPLQQSLINADEISTPPEDIRMIWACGGHGVCLTMSPQQIAEQDYMLQQYTLNWLDHTLKGEELTGARFQFVDQNGQWYTSAYIPIEDAFYGDSMPVMGADGANGGLLAIVPVIGGSGPQSLAGFPASLGLGSEASHAISISLEDGAVGETVVGAPRVTFDYSGVGTSRHIYAQLVDKNTGLVVGNIVTPIPVTMDGKTHQAEIDLENIVYTYDDVPDDTDLVLQIVGSATAYENFTQYGYIHVTNVSVSLPTPGAGVIDQETLPPVMPPPTLVTV